MISKCLFPVAGFGTRFLPVTKSVAKELLPVYSKPLIHYAIDEALSCEINEFVIVKNKYKESIKSYFSPHTYLEKLLHKSNKNKLLNEVNEIIESCKFVYVNQDEMFGLGHAILQGKGVISNEPFAVILPDDLCHNNGPSVLKQMINIHNLFPDKCIVAVEKVPDHEVSKYGIIDGSLINNSSKVYSVKNMIEKPAVDQSPSNLAIIGRYILTPEIFRYIENIEPDSGGEIQITNALQAMTESGNVLAYEFNGKRIDCGSVDGLFEANIFFKNIQM